MESVRPNIKKRLDAAVASRKRSFDSFADQAMAYNALGNTLVKHGELDLAAASYKRAIGMNPNYSCAYDNLGSVMNMQGDLDGAKKAFQKALQLNLRSKTAQHMLAAVSGKTTEKAPPQYVRSLFDQYAPRFDGHLVGELGYDIPREIHDALVRISEGRRFERAVDLGCGTGLCGQEIRPVAKRLTGVDLSGKMLQQAARKRVYDVLRKSDICDFLTGCGRRFDLFTAADVFAYIGELAGVFLAVKGSACRGALFLFSIEECQGKGYVLKPTGRYGHSRPYIDFLSKKYGFQLRHCRSTGIRRESGQWIMGDLYVLSV